MTAPAPTSPCSRRSPTPSSSACSTPAAPRRASPCPSARPRSGTGRATVGPGQRYGSGAGPVRAAGPALPPVQAAAGSVRDRGRGEVDWAGEFTYRFDRPRAAEHLDSGRTAQGRGHEPVLRWANDARLARIVTRRGLRGAREGFTARHPEIPEELRGTYAGLAHPAASSTSPRSGHGGELLPSTSSSRTPPRRARHAQLLGLQLDRVPRDAQRIRASGQLGAKCGVQGMVKALHRPASR